MPKLPVEPSLKLVKVSALTLKPAGLVVLVWVPGVAIGRLEEGGGGGGVGVEGFGDGGVGPGDGGFGVVPLPSASGRVV